MDAKQLKFILEDLRFSAKFPSDVLDHLAAESTMRHLPSGLILFREGSSTENLYLIRSGRLALEMNVPGRGQVRILTLGPGEMVGWSALLSDAKMTATAIVMEPTEVVVAPAAKLLELCETNRDFGYHLMRRMADALSKRLVGTRLQLLDLFAESPSGIPASTSKGEA